MYHIIINPVGGKGESQKALQTVKKLLDAKKVPYIVHETQYAHHATEIARELSHEADTKIIAMGGDGSFHEVLCGIENFENVTLGLIACGSGNDFIKKSGHPKDVEKALDVILKGNVGYVDYMDLGTTRCLNVAGGGMDVDVLVKYASVKKLKGSAAYNYALIYTLLHTRFHKLRLIVDGKTMDKSVFMIGIGNGGFIGGGLPICPHAEVSDGKLDVVIVNEMKKRRIPSMLLKFLKGKHVEDKTVEEFRTDRVIIEALDDSRFELDGEIIEDRYLDIKVVPNKLKMFM